MSNLPSLYELTNEYEAALAELADMELDDETLKDTLEGLAGTLEVKAVNVALFVRNLESTAAAIKDAEKAMSDRRRAIENRAAKVKDYIKDNMIRAGILKIESPYFRLAIQNNPPSVKIENVDELPPHFLKIPEPPPPVPDKTAIGAALKAGGNVPGAWLEQGQRLVIK